MTIIELFFAISLPWLQGILIICLFCSFTTEKLPVTIVIGYGYLLGMVIVTLIIRVLPLSPVIISTALIIFCISSFALLWLRSRGTLSTSTITSSHLSQYKMSLSLMFPIVVFTIISIHVYLLACNIIVKPMFAWDAWATWSVKARTWFELGQIVTFVDKTTWLNNLDSSLHTLDAWHYPDTVPLIQTWLALMINRWDDSLVNLPWLFCFIALGTGFYGQLKLLDIPPVLKITGLYLIVSLPLINTHVALAGYADIWLSTAYTFTMLSLIQYLIIPSRAQLGLTLISACCVLLIKVEGIVLVATLLPVWLSVNASSSLQKKMLIISCVIVAAIITVITVLSPMELNLPYLGKFQIAYHPVWTAVMINYLELPSWHLLGYLTITGLLYSSFSSSLSVQQRKLILIPSAVLLGYLFVLFFLTQNYSWAQQYSSINRITLQLFPVIVFCLFLIFDKRFQNRHMLRQVT
ncbi:MAG TPA: hypothetical protein ENJ32_01320 [Crenotrichaceae bacterium]|nr:hypothetical protein [Crenotrichaceae bacterium]